VPDEADARPIIVCDAGTDPSLGDYRDTILGEGIGALAFVPLAERGRLLGKFMDYYDRPHGFTDEEVQLAQLIAAHVAFAFGRQETVERLSLYREIIAHSSEAVAIIDPRGFYLEQNPAHRELIGYADDEMRDKTPAIHLGVEDRPEVAEAVRMKLEDEGWSVETCTDGAVALEKLKSGERFDVLIFDNKLPDTTGIELIKQTRAMAHRQQTPVIMLSGDEVEM
jgi:PAS domain S-box-containing protein